MEEEEYVGYIDLTKTAFDVDWIRAARLKKACEAGDKAACEMLADMKTTRMWPHDELAARKDE